MSNTNAAAAAQSPLGRDTLFARFMQNVATPLTTGLFAVSAVSGIALFFHWQQGAFHSMHEWLSMVLLAPFIFHVWKNWRPLVIYARRRTLVLPVVASVIVAIPFAYNGLAADRGRGGNPSFRAVSLLTQASLSNLAPILHKSPDALIDALRQQGFHVESTEDTLASVAAASGKQPIEVLAATLPNRQGR